jgi:hypothetical protein
VPRKSKKAPARRHDPCCPVCQNPKYLIEKAPDGRPRFVCDHCEYAWTSGLDGGEFVNSRFAVSVENSS